MVKTCRIVVASERDGAGIDWEGAWDNGNSVGGQVIWLQAFIKTNEILFLISVLKERNMRVNAISKFAQCQASFQTQKLEFKPRSVWI